jgi:hypothetical protein
MVSCKLAVALFAALFVASVSADGFGSGSSSREHQKEKAGDLVTCGCSGLNATGQPPTGAPTAGPTSGPTGATGGPSGSPPPASANNVTYDCPLVEALITISINFTVSGDDGAADFESLVIEIQIKFHEIDNDASLSDEEKKDKKLHHAAYKLKDHFKKHPDAKKKAEYMDNVKDCSGNRFGYVRDVIYIVIEKKMEHAPQEAALDSNDDCPLFEAIRNASQKSSDVNIKQQCGVNLIADLKAVKKCGCGHSYEQEADLHFQILTKNYPQCDNYFLSIDDDDFFPDGFGRYEAFRDSVRMEHLTVRMHKVLSGSTDSDCVFLGALEQIIINVTIDVQIRSQIKGIHDWCQSLFNATTDMRSRMHNASYVLYQYRLLCPWLPSILFDIELMSPDGDWDGDFYDMQFCSNACANLGSCGCVDVGEAPPSTPAPASTPAPTTTTTTTTAAPTTTTTTAGPTTTSQCSGRSDVTLRNGANNSDIIISINNVITTWSATWQISFSPTFNQIKQGVYNDTACPNAASKVNYVKRQMVGARDHSPAYAWYSSFAVIHIKRFHLDSSDWGTCTDYCNCADM